jgi:hypothetical protein
MEKPKPLGLDGEGTDILKNAVLELLNQFPGLDGREITFSGLTEDSGISMEPDSGTLIYTEKKFITGDVRQECQFPFFVVYRSGASSSYLKMSTAEFLDTLGAWICREPVVVDETPYQLTAYPAISDGRKITKVTRFNSYALEPNQNKTQDWIIPITVHYTHEFTMW